MVRVRATDTAPCGRLPKAGLCAIVIFGATGDLTARKLMPAFF
ncbi:MAG: hypothetical protein ABR559_01795, partial [Gemmatimonadota bacterium]